VPAAWGSFGGALAAVAGALTGLLFVALSVKGTVLSGSRAQLPRSPDARAGHDVGHDRRRGRGAPARDGCGVRTAGARGLGRCGPAHIGPACRPGARARRPAIRRALLSQHHHSDTGLHCMGLDVRYPPFGAAFPITELGAWTEPNRGLLRGRGSSGDLCPSSGLAVC
jgi:hypothetical protein